MDSNPNDAVEERLALLTQRVYLLEQTLRQHGIVIEPSAVPISPGQITLEASPEEATTPIQTTAPASSAAAALPGFLTQQSATSDHSLESRIGSQWFNRIGILAVLVGMAWFLKLAIDNHWIGPTGRVLIGIVAGAGLVTWSERFRRRGYPAFSYSLKAVGSGILYLSLWAAFSLFHLIPSSVAFAAMLAVTAFNGFIAWSQDSELLALYAIVGGYSTPLLLATGENHQVALFSYLLLLNLATLALIALRPWSRLLLGSFAGSVFFFVSWSFRFYSNAEFATTVFFLSIFFLLFAFAPHLVRLHQKPETDKLATRDTLALFILPIVNAGLGYLGFYLLVESNGGGAAQPWIAVAFAAFYLLLMRLPLFAAERPIPAALKSLDLVIAVVFLTIAIPLKTHGRWLTIGWLVEGAALLWLTRKVPQRLLRILALIALALGLTALLTVNPPASTAPIFNQRFATYIAGIAVFAFTAILSMHSREEEDEGFALSWKMTAALSVLIANTLILIAVSLEIHNFWWILHYRYTFDYSVYRDYRMYAQFTYSAFFMIFGAILLAIGFVKRSAFFRWQALVLLAISIGKVFLVDVRDLSQVYRILSFLALGALLLGVSFAYQRDWLNLRGGHQPSQ
jgi:uncharacterized membrane protein